MDREQIENKHRDLIDRYGAWTSHNHQLKDDLYTFTKDQPKFEEQLTNHAVHMQRILQVVSDVIERPISSLRVLDLACLEGIYGLEFARHGAEVVAIEAREPNIEKARFAGEALGLSNITFVQDDVRNLSVEKYGEFDVVLCLGIFYHLNVPDVFHFAERIFEVCRRLAIVDTHIGLTANASHQFKEHEYWGWTFREHNADSSQADRLKQLWASLDNETSFWFTRPSIYNLLGNLGFSSVYSCSIPATPRKGPDSDTFVALKGTRSKLLTTPTMNDQPLQHWPEQSQVGVYSAENKQVGPLRKLRRLAGRLVK
ncbi:MAG TPA: class I SAM-dependent methyltransferase [Pyrinomonadaceae bacterium]